MRFSWRALLLAPPVVTGIYAVLAAMTLLLNEPILGFLLFFAVGCVISYGATVFLLLPALFVLSLFARLSTQLVASLGTVFGALAYLPICFLSYRSSGPDSGPPEETFLGYFLRDLTDWTVWLFPVAGLLTAMLYWKLASLWPPLHEGLLGEASGRRDADPRSQ
jgi:hypothetical protein